MRLRGIAKAIELDLRCSYRSRFRQFSDAFERLARAAHGRAQRRYVLAVGFWRLRPGSNEGRPAARLEYREGPLRDIPADGIEHGIAIANRESDIFFVVVDDFISSKTAHVGVV